MSFSRGSSGRERNDKPLSAGPARTGPLSSGSSNKEAPEESIQDVSRRDSDTPKLPANTADQSRLEHSQSRESGESHAYISTQYKQMSSSVLLCKMK